MIWLHTSCLKTCHRFYSSAPHRDLFKLRLIKEDLCSNLLEGGIIFKTWLFFFSCLIWIWQIAGGGGTGWKKGVIQNKKFGFGNLPFIYAPGNMRERAWSSLHKRTDDTALSFTRRIWACLWLGNDLSVMRGERSSWEGNNVLFASFLKRKLYPQHMLNGNCGYFPKAFNITEYSILSLSFKCHH